MLRTKTTTLLRVLGYMSSVLLVSVAIGSAQVGGPPPTEPPPVTPPATPITDRLLIGNAGGNNILLHDGSTVPVTLETFVIPQNLGLAGPRGLTFGPDGHLYVSSNVTDEVLRYDGTTGALLGVFVTKGSGGLAGPAALTFGPDNNLYVSSGDANEVLRYNGTTGAFIDAFVGDKPETPDVNERGPLVMPRGIVFGPDGHLYVSSRGTDAVLRYDGTTGLFLGQFVADFPTTPFNESGGLTHPTNLMFRPDGNLYVNGFENNQVLRYNGTTGAFLGIFVTDNPATPDVDEAGGLIQPLGLTFGPDGNLYVSGFSASQVFRYNGTTGAFIDAFVSDDPVTAGVDETGGLDRAGELLFDPAGNLLVSNFGNNQVMRYNATGVFQDVFAPQRETQINEPATPIGMALGPDNHLYVTSFDTNSVLRYDGLTGSFLGAFVMDDPATIDVDESGGLDMPTGLIFDAAGNLYVSSFANNRVLQYDGTTGAFVAILVQDDPTTPATDESGGLVGPIGLAFDNAGNLYVGSFTSGTILSYDSAGVFRNSLVPLGTLLEPAEIAFGPNGNDLYVSESGGNTIRRFIGAAGEPAIFVGDDPLTPDVNESGGLLTPRGFGFSADGSLLVNSREIDQVLRYDGTTGAFVEVFLSNTIIPESSGRLERPIGMLFLPAAPPPPAEPPPAEPPPADGT